MSSSAKIYKILNTINTKVYVGFTHRDLKTRLYEHKYYSKKENYSSCILFREDPENCSIELIEVFNYNDLFDLRMREAYWKETLDCVNKNTPNIFTIENCGSIRELRRQYGKEYADKHRDILNKNAREIIECECGGTHTKSNKANHKKTEKHKKYVLSLKS